MRAKFKTLLMISVIVLADVTLAIVLAACRKRAY